MRACRAGTGAGGTCVVGTVRMRQSARQSRVAMGFRPKLPAAATRPTRCLLSRGSMRTRFRIGPGVLLGELRAVVMGRLHSKVPSVAGFESRNCSGNRPDFVNSASSHHQRSRVTGCCRLGRHCRRQACGCVSMRGARGIEKREPSSGRARRCAPR